MMRFYPGLDDAACLKMPTTRFFALYEKIDCLEAMDELKMYNALGAVMSEDSSSYVEALRRRLGGTKKKKNKALYDDSRIERELAQLALLGANVVTVKQGE
jgi:hypothetical protein